MTDKLIIGQDYFLRDDKERPWTLFDVAGASGKNHEGIVEIEYIFGRICNNGSGECFGNIHIPGSRLKVLGRSRINTFDGNMGCSFVYGQGFKEYVLKVVASKKNQREVEVVRRPINELESLDDFQLLTSGLDIVRVHQYPEFKPGLFMGMNPASVAITHRYCEGYRRSIHVGSYPLSSIKFVSSFAGRCGLDLLSGNNLQIERVEFDSLKEDQPSKRFEEVDRLLRTRGI